MASEITKRDEDIDPGPIALWNKEGGAPEPLKRGASRLRIYDAVEFEVHPSWGHRAVTQAAHDPRREHRAAGVSYDLWRFSCEMPDAPHLCNN